MDVSVILVNYGTYDLTVQCVESIRRQTASGLTYEIIVVDNGSPDGSGERLKTALADCRVILNARNEGFGAGNNLGLKEATGKYVFLLNTDTILLNDALGAFFRFFEAEGITRRVGCAGCLLEDAHGNPMVSSGDLPTGARLLWGTIKGYWSRYVLRRPYTYTGQRIPDGCPSMDVGWVWGADMFIPRAVLDEIGLFDTGFFLYFEETDLQARMAKAGYGRLLLREPRIVHLAGASSHNVRRFAIYYRSMFHYIRKHRLFLPW